MDFIYKQDLYKLKKKEIDEFLLNTFFSSWKISIILRYLKNKKQNIDAAVYETNLNQDVKIPSKKKNIIVIIEINTGQQA